MTIKSQLALASLLMGAFLGVVSQAALFGSLLERKYPEKFDYQGIVDFYLNNDLTMVHFGHLNDFVNAVTNLRDQHNSGQFTKFGQEKKYRKIFDNIEYIVEFGRVVRSKQNLCNTQHIDELLNYYRNVILNNPFMFKYFANNFHQYVAELGRLCKAKATKIIALFDGATTQQTTTTNEIERNNVANVRQASSLLCNFVAGQAAGKLCIWNEDQLTNFKVEKLEDLTLYMNRIVTFVQSLATEDKLSSVAFSNVKDTDWIKESLQQQSDNVVGRKSLPIQPLHAACELLENVYEQSTAPVDILGHNGIYTTQEYLKWSSDWNNKKWLNIERVCAMLMRTSLEFDKEGHLAYPIVRPDRTLPKPIRQLDPFTSDAQEEQIFQIDFTKTYKSAFTFGARTSAGAFVIGDTTIQATGDALSILFAPIRLLATSITNWSPELVNGLRAIKYGSSAQRDYYATGPLRGLGAALSDANHQLYLRLNKSRFYN